MRGPILWSSCGALSAACVWSVSALGFPSAESIVAWISAVGLGVAPVLGSSYYLLKKKRSEANAESTLILARANAEAYEIIEKARKGTTLAALEDMAKELNDAQKEIIEKNELISSLKLSHKDEVERLRREWSLDVKRLEDDLEECRQESSRLHKFVFEFCTEMLRRGGYIALPVSGEGSIDEQNISKNTPD